MNRRNRHADRRTGPRRSIAPEPKPNWTYTIQVEGDLGEDWSAWFDGFTVIATGVGQTLLAGPVPDQAALHGLLEKVRDLGVPLVSVTRRAADPLQPDALHLEDDEAGRSHP